MDFAFPPSYRPLRLAIFFHERQLGTSQTTDSLLGLKETRIHKISMVTPTILYGYLHNMHALLC